MLAASGALMVINSFLPPVGIGLMAAGLASAYKKGKKKEKEETKNE